jgi:iron complex outermembrane recepter protein
VKSTNFFCCWIGWLALGLASVLALNAADAPRPTSTTPQSGSISGRVQNVATGAYLEGAAVTLEPSGQSALTSRDGSFYFPALPPGEYQLSISYTGLDRQGISVGVSAGQSVVRDVALTSQVYAMEAFTVAGEREGNALAITQQRNAPNVKNVISADAFGNIADQNIGNLLMRLPGIAEEISEGEVTSVSIRGIASDMNSVTVDGTRSASGTTGLMNRGFAIDRIPADFVERLEVTKALTPDMDGDSIGGAVNLRTKSPLDRKGRTISYMGGTSWNLDRDTFQPVGSFFYSDTFGAEEKLGLLLTSSYNKTHKPRDSVYQNWQATAATDVPAYFWMSNLGEDRLEHERIGVGARVDYKLSPTHRVFLNTMYSNYEDTLDRRHLVMTPTAAQIRPGWTQTVTETTNHPVTLSQLHRLRTVETVNMVFGGEKRFQSSFLDYGANYSHSDGTEDRVIPTVQVMGVGFRFDRADPLYPTITQISGPELSDRAEHRITTLNFQDFDDTDIIRGAHLNWKKQFSMAAPASFKTGLRYRGQERERRQKRPAYSYVGPDGVVGRNPATGINDDNVGQFADQNYKYGAANGRYAPVPALDPDRLVQHWRANPNQYPENILATERDALQFNGTVTEDVFAAYLMGDVRLGRLDILAGFRVEETRLSGRGVRQEITPEERARRAAWVGAVTNDELRRRTIAEWSNVREDEGEYRNVLPSLHFKYHLTPNLIARASYSTGLGRPNFADLLRTTTVSNENMRVVAANPDLRPQTADNFDLSLEYYFEPSGFVSAGVFLKEIKDFIYGDRGGVVGAGPDNGFNGEYEGYDLVSNFNGGFGRVRGFELAYNQRFTWLPAAWKGLGLMANYTRLESMGNYSASGGTTTGAELAGFMPETFNAGITYALRSWDVQVKYTYRAENLRDYSANPLSRIYYYSKKNVDLNIKYKWHPRLTVFVDVINVFNDPIANAFVYVNERTRYNQVFTPAIKAGVSGRF